MVGIYTTSAMSSPAHIWLHILPSPLRKISVTRGLRDVRSHTTLTFADNNMRIDSMHATSGQYYAISRARCLGLLYKYTCRDIMFILILVDALQLCSAILSIFFDVQEYHRQHTSSVKFAVNSHDKALTGCSKESNVW